MKKNLNVLYLALALGSSLLAGCDDIASDNRYTPVEKPALPAHAVPKTLLIQEFTGHQCTNCPKGAAAIRNIMEANPGRVITVGMHPEGGGPNTAPIGTQDFRCAEAQVMFEYYHPAGFPCAVFNGLESSTAYDNWGTYAIDCLEEEAFITIDGSVAYDDATRSLAIEYALKFSDKISDPLSIMAWIVEDGIVGFQNDGGKFLLDYVHNHVLRASLNGPWGENLGSDFANGSELKGKINGTVDPAWVDHNCRIVLWVFRNSDKAVMQAAQFNVAQ